VVDSQKLIYAQRKAAFRNLLKGKKLDAYFLGDLSNLYYFTGFWNEGYFSLVGRKEAWLFLPSLLFNQARRETIGFECVKGKVFPSLRKVLTRNRLGKVGFNPAQVSFEMGTELKKLGLAPVPGLVEELRAVKDREEIKLMREAGRLTMEGLEFIKKRLKPGISERTLAADLAHYYFLKAHGLAFNLIVAAGPNSAYPHHITSDYKIRKGDPVIFDVGAVWRGYRSDLTRTLPLGKMTPSFWRVFNIVAGAQKAAIQRLNPGVLAVEVDNAARSFIRNRGFGSAFVHNTGHGVGIDIHEAPRIGPGSKEKLKAGMVVTVEPGIYLPGKFGVRIEDTLLVTPEGPEVLTK